MKRTRLRRVSKKRQEQLKEYTKLKKQYFEEHPKCQICEERAAQDIHHKAGRGSNTNKVETWMALCRSCHDDVHFGTNRGKGPSWARENGYLE